MKVLLINGSPHQYGCTYTALKEISYMFEIEDIDSDIFWIGSKALSGCIACKKCKTLSKCVFNDTVNEVLAIANNYDGFIFGSPVHFASATGAITSFMDRLFYTDLTCGSNKFYLKPAAAIVSARRAGTTATFDQLIKYFTLMQMPVISSRYWNMVHGTTPEEVKQDLEGMQTMRILAMNMAWFLRCKEAGEKAGVALPEIEERMHTNFIR